MGKREQYRTRLRQLDAWDDFLRAASGLPGPRGNLELAQAVADEGDMARFLRYAAITADEAPTNDPGEFLAFCGVVGIGRLVAEGRDDLIADLRHHASDPRWRLREAVAMALQRLGDADTGRLVAVVRAWASGTPLEQRAAAAAICEPRLLRRTEHAAAALEVLDTITASMSARTDRRSGASVALRKGLGYCWSVAVAASPAAGRPVMERWCASDDPDIRWVMRENLRKDRLVRMDADWVARLLMVIGA